MKVFCLSLHGLGIRAAQLRAILSSASGFLQTAVIFGATCQANTLKDITNMTLGSWPGNLSRYLPTGAKLQSMYNPPCPEFDLQGVVGSWKHCWKRH